MRVLIVNTSERTGGAAIAANRLMEALKNNGIKAKMLVRDKASDQITVAAIPQTVSLKINFIMERLAIWQANHFKKHNLFQLDIANTGTDITALPEFKEADIIHLHWINQGYLSLKNIRRIIDSGKPVVWTMHDMWPFTGICHYSGTCENYRSFCHNCPMLINGGSKNDLSTKIFRQKQNMLKGAHITFVACSQWLEEKAKRSSLLTGQNILSIPNTVNANIFKPTDRRQARLQYNLPLEKKLLLFGSLKTTDKRKGLRYLIEACHLLNKQQPELAEQTGIIIVGKQAEEAREEFPFPVYAIDYVEHERRMAQIYNAADAYVTPSLEDNLPNTIVEALSCGIPCVGFRIGGIPEMIDHKENGYIAEPANAADLAEGIQYVLNEEQSKRLSEAAIKKALAAYGETHVANKYIAVYQQAINYKQSKTHS